MRLLSLSALSSVQAFSEPRPLSLQIPQMNFCSFSLGCLEALSLSSERSAMLNWQQLIPTLEANITSCTEPSVATSLSCLLGLVQLSYKLVPLQCLVSCSVITHHKFSRLELTRLQFTLLWLRLRSRLSTSWAFSKRHCLFHRSALLC